MHMIGMAQLQPWLCTAHHKTESASPGGSAPVVTAVGH
jgi:hypothetical protein